MTTAALIAGYLCGLVFVGLFAWLGVMLHMAYTKLDVILGYLENSPAVLALVPLRHGGPWGKLMLIGGITGFVTFSGFYAKRGGISTDDVKKIPAPLMRKFRILQWTGMGVVTAMVLVATLYKVIKAYHI